jgi:hypothetical protein
MVAFGQGKIIAGEVAFAPAFGQRAHERRSAPRHRGIKHLATMILLSQLFASENISDLQKLFERHISAAGATSIVSDRAGVDLQFKLTGHGHILAEIKPCESANTRFAVRTAMGQLLDYKHRHPDQNVRLLVVLEIRPPKEDADLALSNGFAVSYPRGTGFIFKWPG